MTSHHLPFWLAALHLPEIGPRKFMRWLEQFTDIEALFAASQDELEAAGIAPKYIAALKNPDWKSVEADLAWASAEQHHLITRADEAYPRLLKEIHDPPLVLYVRGNQAALSQVQLALVGSRHATPTGLTNASNFAAHLAQVGYVITSGLARGIDAAAHRGALSVKGITIAVTGTGLQHTYPALHRGLVEEIIANNGAVISEFPLTIGPHAANFPRRNRIIAGLSIGVLVVEAALKSGSLISARHAIEQGRDVFAIPGSIHNPLARGCHHLIKQGAKLVETAADIVEELGALQASFLPPNRPELANFPENLAAECILILKQIEYEMTPMDVIILRSALTPSEVSSILLTLELHGLIQSVPGGYVRTVVNY